MNQYTMVVFIVALVTLGSIIKVIYGNRHRHSGADADTAEARRLRDEVKMLRDRVAVLERIATDKESSLVREIERLRDQR